MAIKDNLQQENTKWESSILLPSTWVLVTFGVMANHSIQQTHTHRHKARETHSIKCMTKQLSLSLSLCVLCVFSDRTTVGMAIEKQEKPREYAHTYTCYDIHKTKLGLVTK